MTLAIPSSGTSAPAANTAYLVSLIPTICLITSFIFTVTFHRKPIKLLFQGLTTRLQQQSWKRWWWKPPILRLRRQTRITDGPVLLPQDENDSMNISISSLELEEDDILINEYSYSELFAHSHSHSHSSSKSNLNSNSDLDLDVDLEMSLNSSFDTTSTQDHQASYSQFEEESGAVLQTRKHTTTSSMTGENRNITQNNNNNKRRKVRPAASSSASMEASLAKHFGSRKSLSREELVAASTRGDGNEKLQEQGQDRLGGGRIDTRVFWWWDRLLDLAVRRFQRSVEADGEVDEKDRKSVKETRKGDDV